MHKKGGFRLSTRDSLNLQLKIYKSKKKETTKTEKKQASLASATVGVKEEIVNRQEGRNSAFRECKRQVPHTEGLDDCIRRLRQI